MAGCAKALWLVAGRCDPGRDTECRAAVLELLRVLSSSEGPDELPGDTEPPPVRPRQLTAMRLCCHSVLIHFI